MTNEGDNRGADATSAPLPVYPGPHPGTGYNDHVHSWTRYADDITACHICGKVQELDCAYPGALAFGEHYPSAGRDHTHATDGSAPGYVVKGDA